MKISMLRSVMLRSVWSASFGFAIVLATGFGTFPAAAQVVYAHPPVVDFFSPYDESYGTSPSFQIRPDAYGPAVRVVRTCQYPDGWNVTDFGRDLNGIPGGLQHACSAPSYGGRIRSRY